MIWGYEVSLIAISLVSHFMLSAFVGWLVYWLIQIMYLRTGSKLMADFYIFPSWLGLCLSFSIVAHVLWDYLLGGF